MNSKRKADLQRKLTLAPVAKPPAGLAERIKSEIPKELRLNAGRERERLSRWVTLSIGVAASILIVVISAAYLTFIGTNVGEERKPATTVVPKIEVPPPQAAAPAVEVPAPRAQAASPQDEERSAPPEPALKLTSRQKKEEFKQHPEAVAPAQPPAGVAEGITIQQPAAESATNAAAKVAAAPAAPAIGGVEKSAAAPSAAAAMDRVEQNAPAEMTTSPISGKAMVHAGKDVYDAPANANMTLIPWKDASRETKIAILKTELARGADRTAIVRAAREAGLDELADSIETPR